MIHEIKKRDPDSCLPDFANNLFTNHDQISLLIKENKSDYIFRLDLRGKFLKANSTFLEFTGYKEIDLLGKSILSYIHEEDRENFISYLERLSQSPCSGVCENRISTSNGWKWLFLSCEAIRDKRSKGIQIACLARDVTSRKCAEKAYFESENRFRQIFDSVNNAIAIYEAVDDGSDFIVKEFNRSAEQITNTSRSKIIGRRVSQIFPDIEHFGLLKILQRVWKSGIPEYQPATRYQDQRLNFWAENHIFRLRSGEIVAIFQDVTRYKAAEEKLKQNDEFSRALLEHAPNPILVQNADNSIIYANPACEKLTGYSLTELIGQKAPYPYWPKEKKDEYLKDMQNFPNGEKLPTKIREFQKKTGERFWVELSVSFIRNQDGKICQRITSYIDITERRRSVEKNNQLA